MPFDDGRQAGAERKRETSTPRGRVWWLWRPRPDAAHADRAFVHDRPVNDRTDIDPAVPQAPGYLATGGWLLVACLEIVAAMVAAIALAGIIALLGWIGLMVTAIVITGTALFYAWLGRRR